MWSPTTITPNAVSFLLLITLVIEGETSYVHGYLPTRYYTSPRTYSDNNVYITDKYGQVVSVEPYGSKSFENYYPEPYYSSRCYNCVARTVYDPELYTRKVYVKDRYGNSILVNPYRWNEEYKTVYYPSSRNSRYYSSGRSVSSHEDYVYINDMYGRTRAVPKSSYLYEYAKGY